MSTEKAIALVLRTTDWSESSRIATLWTREFGKVRVLAKGGRRLKSNFETALDLLTVCRIVFIHKSGGGLDLLTEAQVQERFPRLRTDLQSLYAAYFVAELLADWTEDMDPHPVLFDEALIAVRQFGEAGVSLSLRLSAFALVLLRELGYSPTLEVCAACARTLAMHEEGIAFSPSAGGIVCGSCRTGQREHSPITPECRRLMGELAQPGEPWRRECPAAVRGELRRLLGNYIAYLMGRRPKMLPYLSSLP
jgi:DNA repair protein RecO (recombination protein O)